MISIPDKRTSETDTFYANKYRHLATQAGLKSGIPKDGHVAPILVVHYLLERRSRLAKRTWQVYKSACVAQMELFAVQTIDPAEQQMYLHAADQLRHESQSEAQSRGTLTSSLKAKRVTEQDHQTLMAYLDSRITAADQWAKAARDLCEVTLQTGLRPSEWADTWLRAATGSSPPILSVRNAKQTHGRGNGDRRSLDLSELTADEAGRIEAMSQYARACEESEGSWAETQEKIAKYLYVAVRKAFKRRKRYISLYSYRHQFAANTKVARSKAEVAALMGHGSDETAGRNYARAIVGKRGASRVKPVASEVATVRKIAKVRPPQPSVN